MSSFFSFSNAKTIDTDLHLEYYANLNVSDLTMYEMLFIS